VNTFEINFHGLFIYFPCLCGAKMYEIILWHLHLETYLYYIREDRLIESSCQRNNVHCVRVCMFLLVIFEPVDGFL